MAEGTSSVLRDLMDTGNLVRLFKKGEAMDAVLKALSESDTDLTQPLPDGSSLLHTFSLLGCSNIVKLLWERGARPSILKKDNSTILHSTVRTQEDSEDQERSEILTFFLSSEEYRGNSMPVNYKCSKGWTALKLAARTNLERCVEVLLERGADPDIADEEDYTPLHNAIGNPDIVKLLATKSSNIDAQNQDGETPLLVACERGLVDSALNLLENKANPNIANKQGVTPLFLAARSGHLELVKALVRRGASINFQGASQSIGPLHWAAHKESEDIALFLIENGADVLQQDKEGRTPLSLASPELAAKMISAAQHTNPALTLPETLPPSMSASEKAVAACCSGNVQALQVLLQSGISVNYAGGTTGSALIHMAAYCGQLHTVLFLMQQGANWRAVDKEGDTLLHFACMKETKGGLHEKTLEFLLSSPVSALINAQNGRGDTPIIVATRCCFMPRVRLLLQHKADVSIGNHKRELPLHKACSSLESIEALFYYTELTPDLNIQDADGWTPLMYATKAGSTPIVKYLLQKGADPNVRQINGFTALYLAAQEENVAVCRLLLVGGANPHLAGGTQKLTPLHIAAHRNSRAVCLALVEHGADIHQADNDGDTPLSLAENTELKQNMTVMYLQRQDRQEQHNTDNETTPTHKERRVSGVGGGAGEPVDCDAGVGGDGCDAGDAGVGGDSGDASGDGDDRESGEGVLIRQGTFSKEIEREGSEGDIVPQARYQEALQEVNTLRQSLEEQKRKLSSTEENCQLLSSRNRTLTEELRRLETVIVEHHLDVLHKLSLSEPDSGQLVEGSVGEALGHARWLISKSQYEITGPLLNTDQTVGKMYDVYPGVYRQLPVAVKVVRGVEGWGPDVYSTFYHEVNIVSQLQCPWIVQFMGCRLDPISKQCALITEYMPRRCLHSVLHVDKLELNWNQRVNIMKDICRGMVFLHSYDTLHRNLVPRNILIGEHLNAKIGDFGLWETQNATIAQSQNEAPQMYMAPEASEKLEFTQAADVYSFGIVMCEVGTGERPYSEDKPFLLTVQVVMGTRPRFTQTTPTSYQRVAEKCWQGEPKDRPSFESVLRELDSVTDS